MLRSLRFLTLIPLLGLPAAAETSDAPPPAFESLRTSAIAEIEVAGDAELQYWIDEQSARLEQSHPEFRELAVELREEARRPGLRQRLLGALRRTGETALLGVGYTALGASYVLLLPSIGAHNVLVAAVSGQAGHPDAPINIEVPPRVLAAGLVSLGAVQLGILGSAWLVAPPLALSVLGGALASSAVRGGCYARMQKSRVCSRLAKFDLRVLVTAARQQNRLGRAIYRWRKRRRAPGPSPAEPESVEVPVIAELP